MASIFKRGEIWWIQYYVPGKPRPVRRSLKTVRKAVARRELQAIEIGLSDPHRRLQEPRNPKAIAFWAHYLKWAESHLAAATIDLHTRHWRYLCERSGMGRLGDVTPAILEDFKRWRRKLGNSEQSINNYLRDLQAIYNKAIKWKEFTGENPVVNVARYEISNPLVTFHTAQDKDRLLAIIAKEAHTLEQQNLLWAVLLMAWAGLRKKEMSFSRWEWFDFELKIIRVTEFPNFKIKSRRERIIPMHNRIREAMEPYRAIEGFVFESGRDSQPTSRYRYDPKKSLVAALKRANLPTDDPFQRLRRSFGSSLYQEGVDLNRISEWLGNSPEVCRKHYAGIRQEYDADINRM
ncbi:hypothetical protein LCGC14_0811410 [marine sediment metagenome]|uniref:Tyr recombinase domain-containing protein n=1 Tax=marine sediment metagenome TaxID=412755 RepID=A0A0F9PLM6_9ZZZZ